MPAYSGKLLVIKKNTGTTVSPVWTTITGMQTKNMNINNTLVDITNDESLNIEYLPLAGITDFLVTGEGVWKDDAVNKTLISDALGRIEDGYQVIVPGMGTFQGNMLPESVDASGTTKAETRFSFTLRATATITFTAS